MYLAMRELRIESKCTNTIWYFLEFRQVNNQIRLYTFLKKNSSILGNIANNCENNLLHYNREKEELKFKGI